MSGPLAGWLSRIERQHPSAIALGLDRVTEVWKRMGVELQAPVITVGGTNGKGSTCAMLERVLRCAGYRTGLYTSPHLLRYHERVRVAGVEATDEELVAGFEAVERARGEVPLTYFEHGTLGALWLFAERRCDALVLEVGLGGRLDAVNIVDADCAVLGSIAMDHMDWLGDTREAIGREKAGIFRAGRPAVVSDRNPPATVLEEAARIGARLLLIGRDFDAEPDAPQQWRFRGLDGGRTVLAHPALRGAAQLRNAAAAIAALQALRERLPVAMQDIRNGLAQVEIPARYQVLPGRPQVVLDVAHNADAAAVLASNLGASGFSPETIAVCGMLKDKDIDAVVAALAPRITRWHVATLPGPRGASSSALADAVRAVAPGALVAEHASAEAAFVAARGEAGEGDKIVVFGSFLTVTAVMEQMRAAEARRESSHG